MDGNLLIVFKIEASGADLEELKAALRGLDVLVNVNWPLSHYKSAVRYLQKDPEDIKATGEPTGRNICLLVSKENLLPHSLDGSKKADWGKAWVDDVLGGK